jgi:LacI family transcriptional regulator
MRRGRLSFVNSESTSANVQKQNKKSDAMLQRRPTMGDVARLAGVGTMSVSRFLNASGPVSTESAERIRWAVQKLDYRLNEVARSLRGQRSRMIGVIVPNLSDPFFATCAHEIDIAAKAHGYTVAVANHSDKLELERKEANALIQRNIDGLIIVPADSSSDYLSHSAFSSTPIVFLDRPSADSSRDSVLVQNRDGVRLGLEHLFEQGHKRIAFWGAEDAVQTIRVRYQAYRKVMMVHNLEALPYFSPEPDELDSKLLELLRGSKAPTAFLTAHGPSTKALITSLRRLSLRMPDEIALVAFDDFDMAELVGPGVSVVRQPVRGLARACSDLLFQRLLTKVADDKPKRVVLPMELIVRGSSTRR